LVKKERVFGISVEVNVRIDKCHNFIFLSSFNMSDCKVTQCYVA
jgi:hypothetical protein